MPAIKSSTELRNNYSEVSAFCHENDEPVFVTKNGQGDLAVMSIDHYESLIARKELYELLEAGSQDIRADRKRPYRQVLSDIKAEGIDVAV
jgi:prevent-host-death family protein